MEGLSTTWVSISDLATPATKLTLDVLPGARCNLGMGVATREENPKALELQTTMIAIKSQNQKSKPLKTQNPKPQTKRSLKLPQQQIPENKFDEWTTIASHELLSVYWR